MYKLFNVTVVLLYTGTADLQSDVQTDIVEQKEEDHIHSPTAGSGSDDPSSKLSESQYTHVHKLLGTHPPQPIVEESSERHHYSSKHAFFLKSESITWC